MKKLVPVLTVALAAACGDPIVPDPVALDFAGRYEGRWSVIVGDTLQVCGGFPAICGPAALAFFECPTVMDVSATGAATFAGTLSNDVCVASFRADTLDTTPYVTLAPIASFVGSVDEIYPESPGSGIPAGFISITLGAGDAAAHDAVFGCTPSYDWIFGVSFTGPELSGDLGLGPGLTKLVDGTFTDSGEGRSYELRAHCAERPVFLQVRLAVGS